MGCVSRTPSIDFEATDRDRRFGVGTLGSVSVGGGVVNVASNVDFEATDRDFRFGVGTFG